MSECESPLVSTLHIRQNRLQCFHIFVRFSHSFLSWQLCAPLFKEMDFNLSWVMNSSENLMRAADFHLKKLIDSDVQFFVCFQVVSKRPELHPDPQPNDPNLPLLPHAVCYLVLRWVLVVLSFSFSFKTTAFILLTHMCHLCGAWRCLLCFTQCWLGWLEAGAGNIRRLICSQFWKSSLKDLDSWERK